MASAPNLDDITRILDLIATPLALEVLDGLGDERSPSAAAPPDCDLATIQAALDVLSTFGAIEEPPDGYNLSCPVELTTTGERLLKAIRTADQTFNIKYL